MRRLLPILALAVLVVLPHAGASQEQTAVSQERAAVSNQVIVSGPEAGLTVTFDDGSELSMTLRDGTVLVDGSEVGSYEPGGALDGAWRGLLADAVAVETGGLRELLREWSPPAELGDGERAAAERLEARLESAFLPGPAAPPATASDDLAPPLERLVDRLLLRTDRLRYLVDGVRELPGGDLRVVAGAPLTLQAGDVIRGSLLVVDGDVRLDGEVEGDVLLLGGTVTLGEDARVGGSLRWSEGEVEGNRAAVRGPIERLEPVPDRSEEEFREDLRREIRSAVESSTTPRAQRGGRFSGILRNVGRGFAQIFQTFLVFAVLLGMGLALLYFFPRNFEVIARTARHAAGRSVLVGLAGTLLVFPVWVVGIVALTVTVIGIPLMLVWLPVFPVAVVAAVVAGYLAVASNLGRWVADSPLRGEGTSIGGGRFGAFDPGRPAVQLSMGLAVLLAAYLLVGLFQVGGSWFAFFRGLLAVLAVVLTVLAALVGLGALLLSRGGQDPRYTRDDWQVGDEAPAGD